MKKLLFSFLSLVFTITSHSQLPELIYYQFENSSSVTNYASAPVGLNPATITGQTVGSGGFLGSNGLIGSGTPSTNNNVNTGWNTRINGSFTLAFWVNNIGPGTTLYYIFGDGGASSFRCFTNGVAGANNWMLRGAGLPDLLVSGGASSGGKMIHAVYDATSGTYTSFIDGIQNTQVTVPTIPNETGTGLTIGGYNNSSGLSGMIDEFRWYNRALTQTEITATYDIDLNFSGNCTNAFTNLNVNNILATSAQVNWTPGATNTSFWLEYGLAGFTPGNGTMISGTYPGTQPPVNLTGLAVNTNYDYYIGEICNSGADSIYSASPYQFSTTRLCAPPTNLAVSSVLTTSADITWSHAGGANSFTIYYGTGLSQTATSSPFTLTGLSPASTYDVYVQADCGNTNGVSDSLGPINLTTACGIAVAPYSQNFNTGALPNCWSISATSGDGWRFVGNPGYDAANNGRPAGSYAWIDFSGTDVGTVMEVIPVDVSSLSSAQIEFDYFCFNTTNPSPTNILYVEAFDGTNWVTVNSIQVNSIPGWNSYNFSLAGYDVAGVVSVRLRGESGGATTDFYNDILVDDLFIREAPSCPRPPASSFGVSNLLATSADLNWLAGGNELFWGVEWGPAGFTLGSGNFNTTNLFFAYPISGLTATTTYEFYIQAICAPGDTSVWSGPFSFTTPCGALIPPQLEDFSRPFPPNVCWDQAGNGNPSIGPSGIGNSLWSSDGFGNVGTTGAVRCNLNITGDNEWILTPQYDLSAGGPFQVEFDFGVFTAFSSNPGILGTDDRVEVLISRDGGGSWSVLKNFNNNYTTNPNGNHEIVGLPNDSTVVQFAFWASEGTVNDPVSNDVMFDNFEIIPMPACPEPTSLIASAVTANNANISWTPGGSETSWYIEWGVSGFLQGTGTNDSVTTNSYSLTGLSSSTTYDVYIQSFCSTNNLSFWAGPLTFNTPIQGPVGVNCVSGGNPGIIYSDDLETSNGWTGSFGTGTTAGSWNVRTGPTGSTGTGPSGAHSGNNYFYYETSGVNPSNNSITSPLIDLSSGTDEAELSFWIHAYGATMGTLNIGVGNTSTGPFTTIFTNTGQIQTGNNDPYQNVGINLSSYLGQQIYLQLDYTSGTSFTGDIAIDLIEVSSCISCPSPSVLSASNITANSADLSWVAGGTETAWDIQYGNSGFALGSGTTVGVTTNPYFLTGLSSSTAYDYYIKAICAPGDSSSWAGPFTFTTPCLTAVAPYSQNFNNGALPLCWNQSAIGGDGWRFIGTPGYSAGTNGRTAGTYAWIDFSGNDQGTIMEVVPVDVSSLTAALIEFDYFCYHTVNVSPTNLLYIEAFDGTNWVLISSIQINTLQGWNSYSFSLVGFDVNGVVSVRLRGESGGSTQDFYNDILVDDLFIGEAPSCLKPTNLSTSNVSGTSADFSWTAGGTETAWNIEWGVSGFTLGSGNFISVNTNPYSLTGLSSSTTYDVYIQAVCSPGDSSIWAGPLSFTTPCGALLPPQLEDFTAGFTPNQCWEQAGDGTPLTGPSAFGNSSWFTDGFGNVGTTGAVKINLYTTGKNEWVLTPQYDLSIGGRFQVEFDFGVFDWPTTTPGTLGSDDRVELLISRNNGTTWSNLKSFDNNYTTAPGGNHEIVTLPNDSGVVQFAIWATEGSVNDPEDNDVMFDNFEVTTISVCPEPSTLSATNITGFSADLSWVAGGTETAWNIEWGVSGFTLGSGNFISFNTNPYSLTGLSSSTTYDVYIQAVCSPGDSSSWSGPFTFTTAFQCPPNAICAGPYNTGDIPSDRDFVLNGQTSTCPGTLQVVIPAGFVIDSIATMYDFTAQGGAWMSEQRSLLYLPSIGIGEPNAATGTGGTSAGTESYARTTSFPIGLNVNGTVDIEIHAGRTWGGTGCNTQYNKIDDGTWMVIAYYGVAATCPPPSNLTVSNITANSADLSWTAGGTETAWDIQYGTSGFAPGSGTTVGVTTNPYSLTGLSASSTYDYYIKAICAPGDSSSWTGPLTFNTLIQGPVGVNCVSGGISSIVFSDDLEASGSWTGLGTGNSTWTIGTGGTSSFNTGPSSSHNGTSYFYFESSGSVWPMNGAIVSPVIDLSGALDDAELSFWIHAFGATMGNLNLGIGNSATGPFTNVFSNSGQLQTGSNDPYQNVGIDLSSYLGQQIYLQFDYISGSSYTGDIAIDLIEISSCISCPSPSSLSASNITGTSADFSWTAGGTETAWDIQYGTSGFTPGSGNTVGVTANPYSLTGLSASTTYDYYVKAICAPGDSSSWTGPFTFTTPCAALIPPQLEDFTSGFPPNTCWDQADDGTPLTGPTSLGTSSWITDGFGNVGTTGAVKINLFTTGINDWILTPQYDLSTGGPYQIEFDFGVFQYTTNNNGSLPKTLGPDDVVEVLISRDNGSSWNVLKVYDSSYVTAAGGNHETITLNNDTGIVQFGIWASEGTQASTIQDVDVMIDNFEIVIIPCQQPTALGASNITASSADLFWTAGGNETDWEIQYGISGFVLGNGTIDSVNSNPYSLTGLSGSSTYDYYVKAICSAGDSSSWSGPFTFTTLISCPEPNGLSATTTSASSADLSWTAGGTETDWDLQYGNSGFVLGNGTIDSVSSNPYSLTGLSPSTSYDVYIKGICAPGDSSSWAGPFTFVTSCAPGTFQSISSCNTYLWNNNSYDSSGVYIDTLQASNGCDSVVTLNLTINNPVIIQDVEVSCDSVFIWNGNPLYSSGIYLDTLQAVNTCDSVVKLSLTLNYTSSSLTTQTICEGDSLKFGSGSYSIAGLYSDTLQSGIGCDSISTLDLIVTDLIVTIDTSQLNLVADISGGMGPFNYFWSNGSTSSSITPISNGLYSLFINDANGCISNTATYNFIFNTTDLISNLKEILNIYPNPNNGQFIITNSEPINEIFITDLQGKNVYTSKNLNVNNLDIEIYNLEKGMYLVNIFTKNGMNIKTVVIH